MTRVPPNGELYFGFYRFATEEPADPQVVDELRRKRKSATKLTLLGLLMATVPFWVIAPVELGLARNEDFPEWIAWPVLVLFLGAVGAVVRAARWHRIASERARTATLWRFDLLDRAREEIAAQRALGKIPPAVRIAERVWIVPASVPGLAKVDGELVRRETRVRLSPAPPPITPDLRGVLYRAAR